MRTLKHLVILGLVALVAVFLAAPSAMAKKALSEDEMDLITAAGQPKIIQSDGLSSSITFSDTPVYTLSLGTDSQTKLSALAVNNVVGEVELANAVNVASGFNFQNNTSQSNTITQSWGATKDWTSSTVAGVSATATAAASASAVNTATCFKCGINKTGNATAAAAAAAAASTSPGVVKILTKYADQIVESSGDFSPVFVHQNGALTLDIEGNAQNTLSALLVNNVVGLNQVGNAVNVVGGGISANPGLPAFANGPFSANAGLSQTNAITQYRGTPLSRPVAP